MDSLHYYEQLLTFAQNRHVFFNNFQIYKVVEEEKEWIQTTNRRGRSGKKKAVPVIRSNGIESFLEATFPLIKSNEYNTKTGL